jgi:hypothetical protein
MAHAARHSAPLSGVETFIEFELELIQTQMTQKPMLRAEVYARALRASQNVKRAEMWVGARCALRVGGAWTSAGVKCTLMEWLGL